MSTNTTQDDSPLAGLLTEPSDLRKAYRERRSEFIFEKIHKADEAEYNSKGWTADRALKKKLIVKRRKAHSTVLEDRVWCLFYNMGYATLNGKHFKIFYEREDGTTSKKQIDVFAKDDETCIVLECKSRETRGKRSLQKDIHETENLQKRLAQSVRAHFGKDYKPKILWIYVTDNIIWSEPDLERAESANIRIITENELQYFEAYIAHIGTAGRYQFLAEFLQGQTIPELGGVRVAATKGYFGKDTFYAFTTSARHLLKIAFVNHQALNHPDSRPAYQRMISKSRLKKISEFIEQGGFFPTNILVNFTESCRFDPIADQAYGAEKTRFGWLHLPKKYKSAWIIDGQHRLFGFTNLPDEMLDLPLFVIAFEKLDAQREADLFITINHEQKSVSKALLVALQADLKLGSDDAREGLSALSSALVRNLSVDTTSPFFRRFVVPGIPAADSQNLTIPEAVKGLNRSALIGKIIGRNVRAPGFLAGATDDATLDRARKVLNGYFEAVMDAAPERWANGRASHICVNPGIRAHLQLISEILKHQDAKGILDPSTAPQEAVIQTLKKFMAPYYNWLRKATDEEIADKFARKFGEGGVTEYFYALCDVIAPSHPGFGSDEYRAFKAHQADERTSQADRDINDLQSLISQVVFDVLKEVHGDKELPSGEKAYWELGIENSDVKQSAYRKQQQESVEKRAPREAYIDLIDFGKIMRQKSNWPAMKEIFSIPLVGVNPKAKEYHIDWLEELNELRRITAHKSVFRQFTDENHTFISWLKNELYERCERAGRL
jgi:DGQHR domain-containing protein